jgi:cytochrome c-type biogenesis protein CcmF
MAIGPKLKWIKSKVENKVNLIIIFVISILLSFIIVKNFSSNSLVNTILISSALYLFFITVRDFLISKNKNISQNIAHFGFSLLILSIIFNNFLSTEIITNLKIGETYQSNKLSINFEKIEKKKEQNFEAIIGKFKIKNENDVVEILNPQLRIYNQPNIVTSEADIKTNLLSDKFMTMNLVQNKEYFNVRYQTKPFMIWIWFSVLIISFGGLFSLLKKNYED